MNTLKFPDRDKVSEQAAAWVAAIDRGIDDDEQKCLANWLLVTPMHGEVLVQLASVWDMLDVLTPIAKLLPLSEIESIDSVDQKIKPSSKVHNPANLRRNFGLAASLFVATVGISFLASWFGPLENSVVSEQPLEPMSAQEIASTSKVQTYVTMVGEQSNIVLVDGSEIKLNTDSELQVKFDSTHRMIKLLRGEAYFKVAKNPDRPFVVMSEQGRVTAVGTAFSVHAGDTNDLEVLVAEGRVKVDQLSMSAEDQAVSNSRSLNSAAAPVFLTQGQSVVFGKNGAKVSHDQDIDSALAWRDGMIIFAGESLQQAVNEIDRYIALDIKIVDPAIASIPVGGFFKTGDLDQLLLILEQNFGVMSTMDGNSILLSKAT